MDLIDSIQELSTKIKKSIDYISTEEATKQAYIIPFIKILGYDIFDPTEVVPEFTADIGIKKGEKVDYAIMQNMEPIMLFECKHCKSELDINHASQLFRYFSSTKARIGVLTNGVVYRFYTDLEKSNQMDEKPFLEINLLDVQEQLVKELKKFTKSGFDIEDLLSTANELKYTREIKIYLNEQLLEPTDDFVRLFASQVYSGKLMQSVVEKFRFIVKRAFKQFVNEEISKKFKSVLSKDSTSTEEQSPKNEEAGDHQENGDDQIDTTQEELEGYFIIKSILANVVDLNRIAYRDRVSYFGILLDDNNRKPLVRLHFNTNTKYISLFDQGKGNEEKIKIDSLNDIYNYADRIRNTIKIYDEPVETIIEK